MLTTQLLREYFQVVKSKGNSRKWSAVTFQWYKIMTHLCFIQTQCAVCFWIVFTGRDGIKGERIVYLTPNDSSNVIIKWAIWLNGAIAVPLCAAHPILEKQYFVDDSQASLVIGEWQPRTVLWLSVMLLGTVLGSVASKPTSARCSYENALMSLISNSYDYIFHLNFKNL